MLVLLPPSETKRAGGDGAPLSLESLGFPTLSPLRRALIDELVALAADRPAARRALGISAAKDAEIDRNAELWSSPTLPAVERYTGVLYDALDIGSLRGATAARARSRLAVGSALFGLLRADDPVPAYRLSAGSKLPGSGTLASRWRPLLEPVLAEVAAHQLVIDLRSGAYAGLGRVQDAVRVSVVTDDGAGQRRVVSHFNKAHKGRLARILATSRAEPDDAESVAAIARKSGLKVECHDDGDLTLIVS
ncbi:peroxide stress protein YaaA [Mycolicibacterium thermoresistibile]|uniref:Peroxide stress protein YaaA n=2 Tax=Mycolicibacterium thermoresistibile TaxID=1797 RepID=G7CM55_MYCT3|nr:peroxide stress protein YaaA [Mycolicibacterium thermoresistibile]EHI11008.1 hypothetical protein KEK_20498 [Mycolicibacterium thermoresistibile ATCC 19527]MCV7188234.1 peroxide stress protein YaaA [Mycolicibacterium thermoresistibile]GAT13310.1 putative uncharacterized protein [Mycolicibacterium thermoresistibile]SNW18516.1 Protein of uncharacterised function (DUF328) [Mycolicibacterium thermoresistibile]